MAAENILHFERSEEPVPPYDPDEDSDFQAYTRKHFRIDSTRKSLQDLAHRAWIGVRKMNVSEDFYNSPKLYRRDGTMVQLQKVEIEGGILEIRLLPVNESHLMSMVARSTYWFAEVPNKLSGEIMEKEVFPIPLVIKDMLNNPHPPVPKITRIVAAPVFSKDGKIATTPGYHESSRTYYNQPPGFSIDDVPLEPTQADLDRALGFVELLLEEFPFVADSDRRHALSMMLNPFVRAMIVGPTPMYMVEAPTRGTGKGKLAKACLLPALNEPPLVFIPTANDEEMRKRMFAMVAGAPEAIMIDNIDDTINTQN